MSLFALAIAVAAPAPLAACESGAKHEGSAATDPPSSVAPPVPMSEQRPADYPRVYFATGSGEVAVDVEVVATEPRIEKGLMYRQHMAPDDGMLFLLGENKDWKFWMRNTLIPLDMIFIRTDLTIAGISENAEPETDTLRAVGEPSLYVVEVNAGWTKAHGVKRDAKVRFAHVPQ